MPSLLDIVSVFLTEAHKHSYADKNAAKSVSSRLGSEDYHFEKGGLIYHDTYFGSRDFIGEEIVYKDDKPVWGMNYYGAILSETADKEGVYSFLRKALMMEHGDGLPLRGPSNMALGGYGYKIAIDGDLARFSGIEEISHGGKTVYRCLIHGGLIE